MMIPGTSKPVATRLSDNGRSSTDVTVDCLRVAGGILLFTVALDMLHARVSRESLARECDHGRDTGCHQERRRLDFSDCHTLVNSPGAITTVIPVMRSGVARESKMTVIFAILLTFAISYLIFRFANKINKLMGVTGSLVITRVMGLLLGAIAVNFVSIGVWNIYMSIV
jgi:multiple antibiotic resistance protein